MKPVRAVLFDWGGTLIDYPASNARPEAHQECVRAAYDALTGEGLLDDAIEWPRFRDVYMAETLALIRMGAETFEEHTFRQRFVLTFETLGLAQPEPERFDPVVDALADALVARCRPIVGAFEVLQALKGRIPIGLLSNFPHRPVVDATLEAAGLTSLFDYRLVSADLGYVKPNPEIYRVAARGLGASPEHCLYVGDEPVNDVKGPLSAGLMSAKLPGHHAEIAGIEPTFRLGDLFDLLRLPPLAELGLGDIGTTSRSEGA